MEFHLSAGDSYWAFSSQRPRIFPGYIVTLTLPAFKEVQPLFDEELNLLDADHMDACQSAYDRINALGLRLIDTKDEKDIGEFLLYIRGNEAWFRS